MKRILYVTTVSSTINAFLVPHIKYLIEKGYKADVATNITDKVDKSLIDMGTKVYEVDFQRTPISHKNSRAYKQIRKIQNKEKYDMIHVHTPVASFVTRYALRKEKNLKVIYTCHGFHFYKGGSILNWILFYPIEYVAARWTDKLITINSEDLAISKKFKLRKCGSVSKIYGVGIEAEKYIIKDFDISMYRKKLNLNEDDFVILVLSELNNNKNHIQLIKAMSQLEDKYPNIKALFAGVGPLEEEIKFQIKKYGLENDIQLLGWRNDVRELINSCDIVGLFSKREGLGKCLLEGMICGKAIIATNTRGPRELIVNDENGFLFEINEHEETIKSIEKIYKDKSLKVKFEYNGKKKADRYLLENVLCQLDEIYKSIESNESNLVGEIV